MMAEPDVEGEEFKTGTHIILVKKNNSIFRAIKNPSNSLFDESD